MKVSDIMTKRIVTVDKDEPVIAAARLLKRHNIGALPVTDSEMRLRGIITDRDIVLRCLAAEADPRNMRISEIMSRGIITVSPDDRVDNAVISMSTDQVRRLPVVEDGRVMGIVSLCDMARNQSCEMEAAEALSEISANVRRK